MIMELIWFPAFVPGTTELSIVRPKAQEACCDKVDHRSYTFPCFRLLPCLLMTAAVQFAEPVQNAELGPPSAASKKGWAAPEYALFAQGPPCMPQMDV